MFKNSLPAALLAAALVSIAPGALAAAISLDTQSERLDTGEVWAVDGLSVQTRTDGAMLSRLGARIERETRDAGVSERLFVQGSATLGSRSALEVGFARGEGAGYALRSQQHVLVYSALGTTEVSGGLVRTQYEDSVVVGVRADARVPLSSSVTALVGGSASQSRGNNVGGFLRLGLEYARGHCTYGALAYVGEEARDAAQLELGVLHSRTAVLGARCEVSRGIALTFRASKTQAGALTRQGLFGGVAFTY